ncbi:hypothetical protein BH23THE1_BH23THE1_12160 [soil metagenome]
MDGNLFSGSRSLVESKPIKIETPSYMIGPNMIILLICK